MKNLVLSQEELFHGVRCDVWMNKDREPFMTREQIGVALDYKNPRDAIKDIHSRNQLRMDKFSVKRKLRSTDGKEYETILYNKHGIYEICRKSNQPKADAFFDWIYSLLDAFEKGQLIWKEKREAGKQARLSMTDSIRDAGFSSKFYIHFTNLCYKSAIGFNAAQIRKARNVQKKVSILDYLTVEEQTAVNQREQEIATLIGLGLSYEQIKAILANGGVIYQTTLKMPQLVK